MKGKRFWMIYLLLVVAPILGAVYVTGSSVELPFVLTSPSLGGALFSERRGAKMRPALSLLLITVISLSNGYCEEDLSLPPIDPQMIVAGLKHTESLLQMGKCRIHYQDYSKLANAKKQLEAIFAFDSHRICYYYISDLTVTNEKLIILKDRGCKDLYETRTQTLLMIGTKKKARVGGTKVKELRIPGSYEMVHRRLDK